MSSNSDNNSSSSGGSGSCRADHTQLKKSLGIGASSRSISVEMTEGDLSQCMEAFRLLEVGGRLPVAKLKEAFEAAHVFVSETHLEDTMAALREGEGVESMEFYDFATLACSKKAGGRRRRSTHAVLASIFRLLDRDSDGYIGAAELKVSMEELLLLGEEVQAGEAAERMVRQLDTSGRGKVSYEEFVCMLDDCSLGA